MSKHYPNEIVLHVAEEGYGGFYDPDMSWKHSQLADEAEDFNEVMDAENDTALRLSMAYNRTLNVPAEVLYDPVFQGFIDLAVRDFQLHIKRMEEEK